MDKKQVFELLSFLDNFYNQGMSQDKINAWHSVLKESDGGEVMKNAEQHVKKSVYFPKPADLAKPKEEVLNNIPDIEETKKMLNEREQKEIATKEETLQQRLEIERILGIKR